MATAQCSEQPTIKKWQRSFSQQPSTSVQGADVAALHFRFFDLPLELRRMVYKHLPISTTRYTVEFEQQRPRIGEPAKPKSQVTLLVHTMPAQLLRTCQQVYDEAKSFIDNKLQTIRQDVPRMILHSEIWVCAAAAYEVLTLVFKRLRRLMEKPDAKYRDIKCFTSSMAVTSFAYQAAHQMMYRWQEGLMAAGGSLEEDEFVPLYMGVKVRASPSHARECMSVNAIPANRRAGYILTNRIAHNLLDRLPRSMHACAGVVAEQLSPDYRFDTAYELCLLEPSAGPYLVDLSDRLAPCARTTRSRIFQNLGLCDGWGGEDVAIRVLSSWIALADWD